LGLEINSYPMKIILVLVLSTLSVMSCEKRYTCVCNMSGGTNSGDSYVIKAENKSAAINKCSAKPGQLGMSYGAICTLK
jgi:hypothetical protein